MTQKEASQLRSSVLYKDEILYVTYEGKASNFPKNTAIPAKPRMAMRTGFLYPLPKYMACDYYVIDKDGDAYRVAIERYGKLEKGFKWVKE